jgi:hypothetical protein
MPTNVYSSQTIAGYNASPPPDDGSTAANNQLEWAKHKTKLGDPLKTLAEAINAETLAAFGLLVMTDNPAEETVMVAVEEYTPGYVIQSVINSQKAQTTAIFANDLTGPTVNTIVMMQEFI